MNCPDYYLNKPLVQYVSSCLEMRDNLLSEAKYCYLIYFLLLLICFCNAVSLFYGHANKAHCCRRVCGVHSPEPRAEVYCVRLIFNISKLVYLQMRNKTP